MTVLEYLRKATLHGVAKYMSVEMQFDTDYIQEQLLKALDMLSLKPKDHNGMYLQLEYNVPDIDTDPLWAEAYWSISGYHWDPSDDDPYCMAIVPWDEMLSMSVHIQGPWLDVDAIAALLLYEMTLAGRPKAAA